VKRPPWKSRAVRDGCYCIRNRHHVCLVSHNTHNALTHHSSAVTHPWCQGRTIALTGKQNVQDNRVGRQRVGPTCGFTASPEVGSGGHCRYPADRVLLCTSFKSRQGAVRAPTHHHVSFSTGPCTSAEVGSRTATCLAAPEPASLMRRAPAPPYVLWLQIHWVGSGAPCVPRLWILPPY
jgi:hypothetical protein